MKTILWLSLFCFAIVGVEPIERAAKNFLGPPANTAIANDKGLEDRVTALEAKVKTLEEWSQRRGSRY